MIARSVFNASMIILMFIFSAHSFSIPHLFWPQKDIDSCFVNQPALDKKVLIASRDSDYKRALVEKIKEALKGDSVYIKCVGLTQLKNRDTSRFTAVVIINACMSWDWDRNVIAFLKGKTDAANVIVLTTSGSGKWLPGKSKFHVDAIAAASEKASIDSTAETIVNKIRLLIEKK